MWCFKKIGSFMVFFGIIQKGFLHRETNGIKKNFTLQLIHLQKSSRADLCIRAIREVPWDW